MLFLSQQILKSNKENIVLNLVNGERGVGKSYATKKYIVKHFLKTEKQFVYVRRYSKGGVVLASTDFKIK